MVQVQRIVRIRVERVIDRKEEVTTVISIVRKLRLRGTTCIVAAVAALDAKDPLYSRHRCRLSSVPIGPDRS